MAKIPFNLKFRPQIESGEYKVETRNGWPARIICWDKKGAVKQPLIVLIEGCGGETVIYTTVTGEHVGGTCRNDLDLFIVTPEEELTEFEKELVEILKCLSGRPSEQTYEDYAKEQTAELLSLAIDARAKEFSKGLKQSKLDKDSIPYHLIEFMCNLYDCPNWKEIEETAELYVARIKAAAMKDLPRWRKWGNGACGNGQGIPIAIVKRGLNGYKIIDALGIQGEQYIMLSDLEKLPKDE